MRGRGDDEDLGAVEKLEDLPDLPPRRLNGAGRPRPPRPLLAEHDRERHVLAVLAVVVALHVVEVSRLRCFLPRLALPTIFPSRSLRQVLPEVVHRDTAGSGRKGRRLRDRTRSGMIVPRHELTFAVRPRFFRSCSTAAYSANPGQVDAGQLAAAHALPPRDVARPSTRGP
jgi:hypothetical protein